MRVGRTSVNWLAYICVLRNESWAGRGSDMGIDEAIYDVASVGAGVSATGFVRAYVAENRLRGLRPDHRLALIDPRARLGVGQPWDEPHPHLITNMHVHTLKYYGAMSEDGEFEFQMARSLFPDKGRQGHGGQPYVERAKVGDRLHQLYEETLGHAYGQGVMLDHVRSRALRLRRARGHFVIELEDGRKVRARCVVLALGMVAIDRHPEFASLSHYHADGWAPGDFVARVEQDSRVAILGAGPTAIDWVLRLLPIDLRRPITLFSRSGRLPAVRPAVRGAATASAFDREYLRRKSASAPFTGREVELIMRGIMAEAGATPAELEMHKALARAGGSTLFETTLGMSGQVQPFFEGLKRIDEIMTPLWRRCSDEARNLILSKWAPLHATLSFAIPPVTARLLQAALNTGLVKVYGGLRDVKFAEGRFHFFSAADELGTRADLEGDMLINATGFDGDLENCTNPFVRQVLADGMVAKGRFGGIAMDYDTGQVLSSDGTAMKGLYAAGGTFSRTAAYSINSLLDTTLHATLVGMACARYLQLQDFGDRAPAFVHSC